jgi:hypothetical protein
LVALSFIPNIVVSSNDIKEEIESIFSYQTNSTTLPTTEVFVYTASENKIKVIANFDKSLVSDGDSLKLNFGEN